MKKALVILFALQFSLFSLFAQSDDDLFGGSDDDLFGDDGIEVVESVTAKSDLSKGTLFEAGSIKIGGRFDTSISTTSVLYADDEKSFSDHMKDTAFDPTLSAFLTVDARPTDILRMYTKFGFGYPFADKVVVNYPSTSILNKEETDFDLDKLKTLSPQELAEAVKKFSEQDFTKYEDKKYDPITLSINNYFKVKEAFTDFSVADRAFFRFGLHTVTWGTGYFFSPVSDIINASSINPEDTAAQVDGVLNLRTQITFPDSQNCLWAYIVPSSSLKAIDTAFAAKADVVLGGWEIGVGGYYKYQNAPKVVLTASGSIKKFAVFGECVYQYGAAQEWAENTEWDDKSTILQITTGLTYMFKDPQILIAGQYYYDGNNKDFKHEYFTHGHNIAALVTFGKILGNTDVTATLFGMVNFGKDDLPDNYQLVINQMGMGSFINTATLSGIINYTPFKNFTIGCGPYVTFSDWEKAPTVALKLTATLGGGKF